MKLTSVLAASALVFGVFVPASPIPTSPQHLEVSPQSPKTGPQPPKISSRPSEGHQALLSWDPPGTYEFHGHRKSFWEKACDKALTRVGCGVGVMHKGETKLVEDGKTRLYIMVEGAPSKGMDYHKRMRVFLDGSSEDGWSAKDVRRIQDGKRPRRTLRPLKGLPPPQEGEADNKALLLWDPVDSYRLKQKWKKYWEERCSRGLNREGCGAGLIHQGVKGTTLPNGEKTSYVNVQGAPSMDQLRHRAKQMRVYEDSSVQYGWSPVDRKGILDSKRKRKNKQPPLEEPEDQAVHVFWSPADTYSYHPKKKLYWEQRCRQVLAREGCVVGKIHKGETKGPNSTKGHEPMSYVMVEGASSMDDMANSKKMRVFQDTSSMDGWSSRDIALIAQARSSPPSDKKKKRPREDWENLGAWDGPRALLSWDPDDAYHGRKQRKFLWEKLCDQALTKEGCGVGRIHQGETRSTTKKGNHYLRVEGAPSTGMEFAKQMRVFQDGSYENGWSDKDHYLMKDVKRKAQAARTMASPSEQPPKSPLAHPLSSGVENQLSGTDSEYAQLFHSPSWSQQHYPETQVHEPVPFAYPEQTQAPDDAILSHQAPGEASLKHPSPLPSPSDWSPSSLFS